MRTIGPVLLGIAALLLLPDTVESKDSGTGAHLFKIYCTKCHSTSEQAGIGPGLRHISKRMNQRQLSLLLRNGKDTMPPFGTKLTSAQIKDLVDFLKNL